MTMRSAGSSPATAAFPFLVLDAARGAGHDVTVVALKEETFPELAERGARPPRAFHWISLGQLGTCISC
jgi:hypothetical protein